MDQGSKDDLFDDAMAELKQSLNLVRKKFTIIDEKVEKLGSVTDDFHTSTDTLEQLYYRDIQKRQKYYEEHHVTKDHSNQLIGDVSVDLSEIDRIFDKLEKEEQRSPIQILCYVHNLLLMGVIGFSAYIFIQL